MIETDVIGWIMAWVPELGTSYNFEFFAEVGAGGTCKYSYDPFGNKDSTDVVNEVTAMQRADFELNLLKEGKIKKYGMKVIDGYIMPVMGRKDVYTSLN